MLDSLQLGECDRLLQSHDPDRWLACRFIPVRHRAAVVALYAFNADVARIRSVISEPLAGEMRLQYWRDVLNGPDQDHANPLASALWAVLKRYQLPVAPLLALLDARVDDLYDSPPVDVTALELYCGETCSVLFRYAALILADGGETGPAALSGTAGVAYAMTGLLRASGWLAAEGRVVIPLDLLDAQGLTADHIRAGTHTNGAAEPIRTLSALASRRLVETLEGFAGIPAPIRPAYAPLALVRPWLKRLQDVNPLAVPPADVPQWQKPVRLWRAAVWGLSL